MLCLLLLVGCNKKTNVPSNNNSTTSSTTTTTTKEPDVFERKDISKKLYDFGIDLYNKKEYTKFEKVDNKYFISLSKLVSDYKFDDSKMIGTISKKPCDHEKTGIYFDIDNVDKLDYKEYPIMISVYCD